MVGVGILIPCHVKKRYPGVRPVFDHVVDGVGLLLSGSALKISMLLIVPCTTKFALGSSTMLATMSMGVGPSPGGPCRSVDQMCLVLDVEFRDGSSPLLDR